VSGEVAARRSGRKTKAKTNLYLADTHDISPPSTATADEADLPFIYLFNTFLCWLAVRLINRRLIVNICL